MRKKLILYLLTFILFIATPLAVLGATDSASHTATSAASDILNHITDKVAQMGQIGKVAYSGKIRSLGKTSINLVADSTEIFVDTNEATNFYKIRTGSHTPFDFKSLKVSDDINVIGIYDQNTKTLTAKEVLSKIQRYAYSGIITTVSKNGIMLNPAPEGLINLTDLTNSLTMYKLDGKSILVKSRAAEPNVGDWISIIGYIDSTVPNSVTALKFILIPANLLTNTPLATPSAR